jgi:hypothetical protein
MNQPSSMDDLTKKPKSNARRMSLAEATVRGPKPSLGVLSYGRGKSIHSHPGVPKHFVKALEARRKMTLTHAC